MEHMFHGAMALGSLHHSHSHVLMLLSVMIAVFASYTALDLANAITSAQKRGRPVWLLGGSIAMGVGIWSMHFVGMLAFSLPGVSIAYDVFLLIVSIVVAILASALALQIVTRPTVTTSAYAIGSLTMGAAISGMHYIGIASMRMSARWTWDYRLVLLSILIAVTASFVALRLAFKLRSDLSTRGFIFRMGGAIVMGLAIAGMHYTGMGAMQFFPSDPVVIGQEQVVATSGLAVAVIGMTLFILGIALTGSVVDRALARRQAGIEARDDFLSMASHELKTPLTSLKLQTQLRQRLIDQDDWSMSQQELRNMFDSDARQINRLSRLIDDMLDISRINSKRLVLHTEPFDLCALVNEAIEAQRMQFQKAGCAVELKAVGPIEGQWDRFRIEQVLTNLFTNALRYGAGRPVVVTVNRESESLARVSVRDNGRGLDPEDHERVFNRFERAVPTNEISGMGLGLYIARQIVTMHGGSIHVDSKAGAGANFYFELPTSSTPI